MTFSQAGIDLLKEFEGFKPRPYNDHVNNSTIGYGTLLHRGPVDLENNAIDKQYANGISEFTAEQMLLQHVQQEVAPLMSKYLRTIELNQNQYDALCCFLYNVGLKGFFNYVNGKPAFDKPTHLYADLISKQFDKVRADLMRFIYAGGTISPGLQDRRGKEADLFYKPVEVATSHGV